MYELLYKNLICKIYKNICSCILNENNIFIFLFYKFFTQFF